MDIFYFCRNIKKYPNDLKSETLSYYDVTILVDGQMSYRYNGEDVQLSSGDAIVYRPGDVRRRFAGGPTTYYSFNALYEKEETPPQVSGHIRDAVTQEIESLLALYETARLSDSLRSEEKCRLYFAAIMQALYERSQDGGFSDAIIRIKRYIASHLHEQITAEGIAGEVFLSSGYISQLFREKTGETVSAYILRMKMEEAKRLILHSDLPLYSIAHSLGYSEYSYFSRCFRRFTGVTPQYFRKSVHIRPNQVT